MLKRKAQNAHATLLALFLNAVHEAFTPTDYLTSIKSEGDRLRRYLPIEPATLRNENSADFLKFNDARIMFRDVDKAFQSYVKEYHFEEAAKAAGLKMKSKNTIVEAWPMRLKSNATQDEFELLLASGHTGTERYVEWRSAT